MMTTAQRRSGARRASAPGLHSVLHRWFVEYNPLYLLSAALVLAGLTLMSRAVAQEGTQVAVLGVSAVAEVYSLALIAGAAVLTRIGKRRPAAMLGLLVVAYQGDLTLHVEACAYLGATGKLAAAAWVALFVLKLRGLAWALELRLSRSALLVPALGAAGLAAMPHVLRDIDPGARGAIVALSLFALAASALWTRRRVEHAVPWDARGLRCVRGTWAVWGALTLGHVGYWAATWDFWLATLAPAVPFLALRWARREWTVWITAAATILATFVVAPQLGWVVAAMAAASLLLLAERARVGRCVRREVRPPAPPYRSVEPVHEAPARAVFEPSPSARGRLLVGAVLAAYLGAWTAGWSGTGIPEHRLWADLLLLVACVALARLGRRPMLAWPIAPVLVHSGMGMGLIPVPSTTFEWGVAVTAAGFVALTTGLLASWRHARQPDPRPSG